MLCQSKIHLGRYVTTYCMLNKGHAGDCRTLLITKEVSAVIGAKPKRCESVNPKNQEQCGFPHGHFGNHSADERRYWS
jgi:hypothetical protein